MTSPEAEEPAPQVKEQTPRRTKTIFFIRHAESEENRRLGSLKSCLKDFRSFSLPKAEKVAHGMQWFNLESENSHVSDVGKKQIEEMAGILKKANFLDDKVLVVHSPLIRAKHTCEGVLGCLAPDKMSGPIKRVVELDILKEKTVFEWTVAHVAFLERLRDFEHWLVEQPENNIVVVGHSQHFRILLGLDFKFGNCDVWQAEFDANLERVAIGSKWSKIKKLYVCHDSPHADGIVTDQTPS